MELHPGIIAAAQAHFGLRLLPGSRALGMDALQGVHLLPAGAYDHIIHDVFGGGDVPEALVSPAFFRLLRSKMTPTGVLSINFYVRRVDLGVVC